MSPKHHQAMALIFLSQLVAVVLPWPTFSFWLWWIFHLIHLTVVVDLTILISAWLCTLLIPLWLKSALFSIHGFQLSICYFQPLSLDIRFFALVWLTYFKTYQDWHFPYMPTYSPQPQPAPVPPMAEEFSPFNLCFIIGNISKCAGCGNKYTKCPMPPYDLCIQHCEWRSFTLSGGTPQICFLRHTIMWM